VSEESVSTLAAMGFTTKQAEVALKVRLCILHIVYVCLGWFTTKQAEVALKVRWCILLLSFPSRQR